MELNLIFNEGEFKAIYENGFNFLRESLRKEFHSNLRKIIATGLFIGYFLFFLQFNFYLPYYFSLLLFLILLIIVRNLNDKKKLKKRIENDKVKVSDFISKLKKLNKIKYIYDSNDIHYYEDAQLISSSKWSQALNFYADNKLILIYFKNETDNIFIPKGAINSNEWEQFNKDLENLIEVTHANNMSYVKQ